MAAGVAAAGFVPSPLGWLAAVKGLGVVDFTSNVGKPFTEATGGVENRPPVVGKEAEKAGDSLLEEVVVVVVAGGIPKTGLMAWAAKGFPAGTPCKALVNLKEEKSCLVSLACASTPSSLGSTLPAGVRSTDVVGTVEELPAAEAMGLVLPKTPRDEEPKAGEVVDAAEELVMFPNIGRAVVVVEEEKGLPEEGGGLAEKPVVACLGLSDVELVVNTA